MLPGGVLLLSFPHYESGDAGAIHLLDAQSVAVEDDLVADLGGAAQVAEDEGTDGIKVLALELREDLFDLC